MVVSLSFTAFAVIGEHYGGIWFGAVAPTAQKSNQLPLLFSNAFILL